MNNMKFIFITIITILFLSACGGAEERKAAYLEKARLSIEAGDLEKARIELKNVLQIDPKDAVAYFKLGRVHELKNDFQKAFGSYSKAIELDPENLEYQAKIGRFYLVLAGDIDKAIEKRDLILSKDETNIHGLMLKAGIFLKQKDIASAKKISQDIFSRQPEYIENVLFLSRIYLDEKEYDSSIEVLNTGVKGNPESRSLKKALADTYLKAGKYDLAENGYRKILEKNPEVYANYLILALFYNETGNVGKAEDVLREGIEADVDDAYRKLMLVKFIQQKKGSQAAIEELKNLIANNQKIGELRLALARLYADENNENGAEQIFKSAISDFSEESVGIKSRVYLAEMYIKKNNLDAAKIIIDEAIKISPNDSEVNFVKAKLLMVNKDYEGVIIALRTVIKDDQENIRAYIMLAVAHRAIEEDEQAAAILKRAYENNRSNTEGLMILARYYARTNDKAELDKVVDSYLAIQPNNYDALSFKSILLNERKMFSEARPHVLQMIKLYPDKPNGYIQSIPYLLAENKQSEAISLLDEGYKKVDDNARILELMVTLHVQQKDFKAAESKVQSAISDKGEIAELRMLLAKVQLASKNVEGAKTNLIRVSDIKSDWNEPYLMLANIYRAEKQNKEAIDVLQKGLSVIGNDLKLVLDLVRLYEKTDDYNAAIDVYEKAYKEHSSNIFLANNLAALLSEHRSDEASLKFSKELAEKLKKEDKAAMLDTAGWVYYKTGDYAEAVTILKKAVEKSPDVSIFNYHLGMAYIALGDESSAKVYLSKSLEGASEFLGKNDAEARLKKLQ